MVSTPAFRSAHQSQWRPTLIDVFWVQHDKGEYKAFCTGGVLSQSEDTRVETANEGSFSSQICSEWVDGVKSIVLNLAHQQKKKEDRKVPRVGKKKALLESEPH